MDELDWIHYANGGQTDTHAEVCYDLKIDTTETVQDIILKDLIVEATTLEQQETDAWTEFETAIDERMNSGEDDRCVIEVYTVNRDEPQMGKDFVGLVNSGDFETSSVAGGEPTLCFTTQAGEEYSGPLTHFSFSSGVNR